jgi:hypothetical protein
MSPCLALQVKALVLALSARIELGGESEDNKGKGKKLPDDCRWRCAWGAMDSKSKWSSLDAVEQVARAPPRTVGHCLELLVSAGIAVDEIKEWAEGGVLRIHLIGADSAFELTSRLEDIIHIVTWAMEVEVILIGFNWSWAEVQGSRTRVRDPDAPSPPRVLKTLSKRKFLDRRRMYVRGFQGYYHEFIDVSEAQCLF